VLIAPDVLLELRKPEGLVAGGRRSKAASWVTVPEAALHLHDRMPLWQHNVGPAGQPPVMKTKPKACRMKGLADHDFRFGVAPLDAGHHPRTGFRFNNVHRDDKSPGNRYRID